MNRKEFLQQLGATGGALAAGSRLAHAGATPQPDVAPKLGVTPDDSGRPLLQPGIKRPRAITMWDFSWLERRWPGAGYEDWDSALDELQERGYDAVRIDAYPHLVAADPHKSWLLKPKWDTQDWGSPTLVRVRVLPELHEFISKCRDRGIKVGLSTWYREDEDDVRAGITGPDRMAATWNTTLAGIREAGLLDNLLYVDLSNEWPTTPWAAVFQPPLEDGHWFDPRALSWMRTAIAAIRAEFPELPLLYSTDIDRVEAFAGEDLSFVDAIEHHLWMTSSNEDEFYTRVGYRYETFSQAGYHNVQLLAADLYPQKRAYWQKLLTDRIALLASAARRAGKPLMTTECWAIVDYKDWPLLPWDWVKELCALGAVTAAATGQWVAIATSNFCGPQFRGMWRDVKWHQHLTQAIHAAPIDHALRSGRLWARL